MVLRVDSPGGSYVASDVIWREVGRLRAAGTPVVASMGDIAGSGGYFVAMGADAIVAQPGTLTGSIGVFSGKVVTAGLLERLGVATDAVAEGRNARMFTPAQGFDDDQWRRLEEWLDRVYADFVGKVAQGRGLTPERAHELARGRVWTGADAYERGLVDELGGLRRAAELARSPGRAAGRRRAAPLPAGEPAGPAVAAEVQRGPYGGGHRLGLVVGLGHARRHRRPPGPVPRRPADDAAADPQLVPQQLADGDGQRAGQLPVGQHAGRVLAALDRPDRHPGHPGRRAQLLLRHPPGDPGQLHPHADVPQVDQVGVTVRHAVSSSPVSAPRRCDLHFGQPVCFSMVPRHILEMVRCTMREPRRTGFVDESYGRDPAGRLVYVLGLIEVRARIDGVRDRLRELPAGRGGILHFREEDDHRKIVVAKQLADLGLRSVAVVCATEVRAERARGLCVRDLAWAVRDRLDTVAFESRGPTRDRHDLSVVRGLARQGVGLECAFPGKWDEPMLWAADFVAGAVRLARTGKHEPLAALGDVEIREV